MHYAIIAAGEGSRLAQEGVSKPKPLVEIDGEPMIGRLVGIFTRCNAESISISDINFFILLRVLKCPSVLSDMELPVWQTKIHLIFVNAHTLLNFVC